MKSNYVFNFKIKDFFSKIVFLMVYIYSKLTKNNLAMWDELFEQIDRHWASGHTVISFTDIDGLGNGEILVSICQDGISTVSVTSVRYFKL